jgi:hypothetical protein
MRTANLKILILAIKTVFIKLKESFFKLKNFQKWQIIISLFGLIIASIVGFLQIKINEKLAESNLIPSVRILYDEKEKTISVLNLGDKQIFIRNMETDDRDWEKCLVEKYLSSEGEALITPNGSYFFLAPNFEEEIKCAFNSKRLNSFYFDFKLPIENISGCEYIFKGVFYARIIDGNLIILTQTRGISKTK